MMTDWIPFDEGIYRVEQAFLITPDLTAAALENAILEINLGRRGMKQLKGRCLVHNILIVRLLEDTDEIDLILDLGGPYKYRLKKPELEAGKVFSPQIKSSLQFTPSRPWKQIPQRQFIALMSDLKLLTV